MAFTDAHRRFTALALAALTMSACGSSSRSTERAAAAIQEARAGGLVGPVKSDDTDDILSWVEIGRAHV